MAATGNGSTKYIKTTSTLTPYTRYAYHFLYQNPNPPTNATSARAVALADGAQSYDIGFDWSHVSSPKTFYHKRASTAYDAAVIPDNLNANTWYGLGASYDGFTLRGYLNGILKASTAAADPTTGVSPRFSVLAGVEGTVEFDAGTVAEVALWNIPLTDAEFAMLGQGVSPLLVHPSALVLYWPLVRDFVPFVGGALTMTAPSVSTHAPVVYAGPEGSLGPDAGGLGPGTFDKSLSTALTLGTATSLPPGIKTALTLGSAMTTKDLFRALKTDLRLHGAFAADSGYLDTGRSKGRNA